MESENRMNLKPGLIGSAIILGLMLALSAWAWIHIPAGKMLPVHWGLSGRPDRYGGRVEALLGMPLTALFMVGLFLLIARIEPRRRNIRMSTKAYTALWLAVLVFFFVMHAFVVLTALGRPISMDLWMPIATGIVFIITGNYLGKIRSNFFAGIRTPWTLSSDFAWDKTHRLGGRLFILLGVITALGFLLRNMTLWTLMMLGELVLASIMLSIYSYFAWKMYPNREGVAPGSGFTLRYISVLSAVLMLLMAGAFVYAASAAKPKADLTARAKSVVMLQAKGDFAGAERDFDEAMKSALPPEKLEETWGSLTDQFGPFEKIESTRISPLWPYTIVFVAMKFQKDSAQFKVVFSSSGKVSGLWVEPAGK